MRYSPWVADLPLPFWLLTGTENVDVFWMYPMAPLDVGNIYWISTESPPIPIELNFNWKMDCANSFQLYHTFIELSRHELRPRTCKWITEMIENNQVHRDYPLFRQLWMETLKNAIVLQRPAKLVNGELTASIQNPIVGRITQHVRCACISADCLIIGHCLRKLYSKLQSSEQNIRRSEKFKHEHQKKRARASQMQYLKFQPSLTALPPRFRNETSFTKRRMQALYPSHSSS